MFKYTKPRGDQVSFFTECWKCRGELTISNGRPETHTCEPRHPISLADIRAALDNRN